IHTTSGLDLWVDKVRTSISLRSDPEGFARQGDIITLSGEVTPIFGVYYSKTVPVYMTVTYPNGTVFIDDTIWTDNEGRYQTQIKARDPGHIHVKVEFLANTFGFRYSSSEMIIPVLRDLGMAIIVAGGGYANSLFPTVEYLSDLACQALRRRNVQDEAGDARFNRIWYMHPNLMHNVIFDNDGQSDVDATPTLANLEWAIKTWAANLIQMKDSSGYLSASAVLETPLSIFLFGDSHTITGNLYINNIELISGSILDNWLDELEDSIKNQFIIAGVTPPDYLPINILIESPKSGSFIQPLSQYGRVILTSTTENGPSYLASDGSNSFSGYFLSRIAGGHYIFPSFAYAQLNILSNPALEGQEPQIEATGNGISNEVSDEIRTACMSLEFSPSYDCRPKLQNGLGQLTLYDIPAVNLWVYADDPENNMAEVAATIIPPQGSYEETKTIILRRNPSVAYRYEGVYDRFFGEGVYTIIYTAIDGAGNAAHPLTKHMIVSDSTQPLDVTQISSEIFTNDVIKLAWNPSESPDTQGYRIYVTPPNSDEYLWGDIGNTFIVMIDNLDLINNPGEYAFRVTAYDRANLESLGGTINHDTTGHRSRVPIPCVSWNQVHKYYTLDLVLDASSSFNPEDSVLTYQWKVTPPARESQGYFDVYAIIDDPTSPITELHIRGDGEYSVELTIDNGVIHRSNSFYIRLLGDSLLGCQGRRISVYQPSTLSVAEIEWVYLRHGWALTEEEQNTITPVSTEILLDGEPLSVEEHY
ncbi:fibronectin type III domain-containing protein, partial [Candidatus Pacearchaeota archaeon]|nr:fibronectin type III domain-containing protein [Candidatus Pacearchaeota archaeon]